jgi:ammonia channel protein AmtB
MASDPTTAPRSPAALLPPNHPFIRQDRIQRRLTIIVSIVATIVIAAIVKSVVGLRPTVEQEQEGLDQIDHGEAGYNY